MTLTGFGARGFAAASSAKDCASDVTAAPFQDSSVRVCAKSGWASLIKSLGTQAAADLKGNDGPATTPATCSKAKTDGSSTESGRALSPSIPSFFREARGTCLKDQDASTSVGFDRKTSNSDVLSARTTPKACAAEGGERAVVRREEVPQRADGGVRRGDGPARRAVRVPLPLPVADEAREGRDSEERRDP